MKFVVHCYDTELLPEKVWRGLKDAIVSIAKAWGVSVDIEESLSVQEAERRCP